MRYMAYAPTSAIATHIAQSKTSVGIHVLLRYDITMPKSTALMTMLTIILTLPLIANSLVGACLVVVFRLGQILDRHIATLVTLEVLERIFVPLSPLSAAAHDVDSLI